MALGFGFEDKTMPAIVASCLQDKMFGDAEEPLLEEITSTPLELCDRAKSPDERVLEQILGFDLSSKTWTHLCADPCEKLLPAGRDQLFEGLVVRCLGSRHQRVAVSHRLWFHKSCLHDPQDHEDRKSDAKSRKTTEFLPRVIVTKQLTARKPVASPAQGLPERNQDRLAEVMTALQEKDGSWWDYPLYDYHRQYGTAYARMTLARCKPPVTSAP